VVTPSAGQRQRPKGGTWAAAMSVQAAFGLSERRTCDLVRVSRRVARYRSTRPDDAPLRARLRELAAWLSWFGYRRLR
jgi:putative transposase